MYITFSEGPLPSILCPEAIQWVVEVLKVPMNHTIWVMVGSHSPYQALELHIRLKSEVLVVFGLLKAAVDELPKETIELATGTLTEPDSLAPIYWEFALPQLDKGVPVDRARMAYVPDDPDEQVCMDSMPDVYAEPKGTPKPKASKPEPKKGTASNPLGVDAGKVRNPKQRLRKGLDHPLLRLQRRRMMRSRHNNTVSSWSLHTKPTRIHCLSRKYSHRH